MKIARALIKAGANMHLAMQDGSTPIFIAYVNRHLEIVRVLKKAGASLPRAQVPGAPVLEEPGRRGLPPDARRPGVRAIGVENGVERRLGRCSCV